MKLLLRNNHYCSNMKKGLAFLAFLLLLAGCTEKKNTTLCQRITPLSSGISVDSLRDCTIAAGFSVSDFEWNGGNLTMTVYSDYRYDAVDVARLHVGDTIVYENDKPLLVDSIERRDRFVIINGGIEMGGAELTASNGGTYRATTFDDHSVYRELGKRSVRLADDFVIIDCGENPTDPSDTISSAQKRYLSRLKDYKREFSPLNTRVRIEDGKVKEINRHWIP